MAIQMFRATALALFVTAHLGVANAQTTVFVNDGFETYTDTNNLWQTWVPRHAGGTGTPDPIDDGVLFNALEAEAAYPGSFPNGGPGQVVDHIGEQTGTPPNTSILQYEGGNGFGPGLTPLLPTATQNVVLAGDIYHDGMGNKRMSIGLRSNLGENIVELGFYNGGVTTNNLGQQTFLHFAHRLIVFPGPGEPNWVYPALPLGFDTDEDGVAELFEVGAGWHRFQATIGLSEIVIEIDLFRDGMTLDDEGMDISGPDVVTTYALSPETFTISANGFDSLRLGGPSGLSSAGGGVLYDNIYLALEDISTPMNNADFNGDGIIDAADYAVWRDNDGTLSGATQLTGDANGDGAVNITDYNAWRSSFGSTVPASLAVSGGSVPEPSTLLLCALGVIALAAKARRSARV